MPGEQGLSSAVSYEGLSKHQSTHSSFTVPRKTTTSEALGYSREQYRRSENYNTHQKSNSSTLDVASGAYPTSTGPSQEANARSPAYIENNVHSNGVHGADHTTNKRDSWREQEQFLIKMQQMDVQSRAKKRESVHSAFPNGNGEESRRSSKTHSRPPSPHLPSGIPPPRTKSRSGIPTTPTAEYKGRPTPPPRSRSRTPAGSSGQTSEPTPQPPQVPRQYSGEYSSSLRKSLIMTEDSPLQRQDHHRSPVSSTPNSKSGTPLPLTADTVPVPIANMTKHLSTLDLKDSGSKMSEPPVSAPAVTSRQSSGTVSNSNRRSIVFDIPNTPSRSNGNSEASTGRMKDVGVAASSIRESLRERSSTIANSASQSSSIRKRGKVNLAITIYLGRMCTQGY
ncbi:hypothetical protein BGX31_008858 [Mortierella sp. GBA43]|nr:hypothetical protein BGX31_008858 [Mortierella sp. GBA43]